MKLVVFNYGKTEITGNMAFQAGDENVKIPISLLFFLIEDGDKKILVDVGCETMPGFPLFKFEKPVDVLESYGVDRKEITDVIITHAHHDHIDALYNYPQAVVHIHRDELEPAQKYLYNSKKISIFGEEEKILDNVEIRHIGGHSEGSSIVLLYCDECTYVLCGDECYTKENLGENKPTGCSINLQKSIEFVKE